MKTFKKLILLAAALAGLAGCRELGYNSQSADNTLTPGTSPHSYDRTYDKNGNPTVTPAPNTGANDPAKP